MFIRSTYHHKKILIIGVLVMVGTMGGAITFATTSNTLNQLQFQANSGVYSITTGTTGDLNISTQPTTGGGIGIGTRQQGSALYINTSNYVGIGTTNPGYTFSVAGNASINGMLIGNNAITSGGSGNGIMRFDGTNVVIDSASTGNLYLNYDQGNTIYLGTGTSNNFSGGNVNLTGNVTAGGIAGCSGVSATLKTDASGRLSCGSVQTTDTRVAISPATSMTVNWSQGRTQSIIMPAGTDTITLSGGADGGHYTLILQQPSSSTASASWSNVRWAGGIPPTLSNVSSKTDYVGFIYQCTSGTCYYDGTSFNANF